MPAPADNTRIGVYTLREIPTLSGLRQSKTLAGHRRQEDYEQRAAPK
jgi:hypothetical protein